MRVTGIRYNGKNGGGKPTERYLDDLCQIIVSKAARVGFITDSHRLTGSAIKIGLHMSSFRVNTDKLGHNARIGRYVDSPKGYKRTDVPTWDQRVEFNDLVNSIFDKFGLVANIKSGPFTIRDKAQGAHTESDWENQTPSHLGYHGASLCGSGELYSEILPEAEARERCDSDRLEAEHKAATAEARRATARAYRERIKLFKQAKRVSLSGFYSDSDKNGSQVTHKQFEKLLSKLDRWTARRVKLASIETTANAMKVGF